METKNTEVLDFIKSLSAYTWLKPNKDLDEGILERLVYEHLTELSAYGNKSFEGVGVRIVRTKKEYYATYNAARNVAWNATWNAAWDAARDAASHAAYDAARDAAYYAAYNAARDATYNAASHAAYDATYNAAHLVSGLPHNPRTSLMEIWALGCAPVGVNNNEFVVYVPEAK